MRKLLLIFLILLIGTTQVSARNTAVCWVYEISAEGYMSYGNTSREFQQAGYLGATGVALNNSANSQDIAIIMGTPVTNPSVGALSFASNGYFIGSLSRVYRTGALDLAEVETRATRNNTVVFEATIPDDFTSNFGINQGLMGNLLNWGGGLTAGAKLVVAGAVRAEFDEDGNVAGVIELGARDWTANQTDIYYYAEFSGTLAGAFESVESCVISSR